MTQVTLARQLGEAPVLAARLGQLVEAMEVGFRGMLRRLVELPTATVFSKTAQGALAGLGTEAQYTTLYDQADQLCCTVASDAWFTIWTAGILLMIPRAGLQERARRRDMSGLILDAAAEVTNVVTGKLAQALGPMIGDPDLAFLREERNAPRCLPPGQLIVVSVRARIEPDAVGKFELWLPPTLADRLRVPPVG